MINNFLKIIFILLLSSCITVQTRYTNNSNIISKTDLKKLIKKNKRQELKKEELFSVLGNPDKITDDNFYKYYLKETKVKIPGDFFHENVKEVVFTFFK